MVGAAVGVVVVVAVLVCVFVVVGWGERGYVVARGDSAYCCEAIGPDFVDHVARYATTLV